MQTDVDYDTPEKQPDLTKCKIIINSIDNEAVTISGVCIQIDAAGKIVGVPISFNNMTIDMAAMSSLNDAAGLALQVEINPSTGVPYLPKGKVVIKP